MVERTLREVDTQRARSGALYNPAGMTATTARIADYLSPGERLGEILFGLIVTLGGTLATSVVFRDAGAHETSRTLLVATLGFIAAWAAIDAVLFLLTTVFDRSRLARLGRALANDPDEYSAIAAVANELDETLVPITSDEQRIELYREIVSNVRTQPIDRAVLHRVDVRAAFIVFASVFIACLPAALPYLLIEDSWWALRASNALLIAALFWVGYRWASYTTLEPKLAGSLLTMFGLVLVLIAMALGG